MRTVTIGSGTSLSDALDLRNSNHSVVGIQMPAAWTAAVLSFEASGDGGATYAPVEKPADGTELSLTVEASKYYPLAPGDLYGVQMLKLRSGTSGAAVNQGADRVIRLVLAPQ
jgi:hypothetical protein